LIKLRKTCCADFFLKIFFFDFDNRVEDKNKSVENLSTEFQPPMIERKYFILPFDPPRPPSSGWGRGGANTTLALVQDDFSKINNGRVPILGKIQRSPSLSLLP